MKKFTFTVCLISVLILSACGGYTETSVSEDGNTRMLLTEYTEEVEVPSEPKNIVLMRATDIGNAILLDANIGGVSNIAEGTYLEEELNAREVQLIESGDMDAIQTIDPDFIITHTLDEHYMNYRTIATTLQVNTSSPAFGPFSTRDYISHMQQLGVILNAEEEANQIADEWLEARAEYKRSVDASILSQNAIVITETDSGYIVRAPHEGDGTEAIYDVLEFNISSELNNYFKTDRNSESLSEFSRDRLNYDIVFLNVKSNVNKSEIANALNIDTTNIYIHDYDLFKFTDLMSIEKQVQHIVDELNE